LPLCPAIMFINNLIFVFILKKYGKISGEICHSIM